MNDGAEPERDGGQWLIRRLSKMGPPRRGASGLLPGRGRTVKATAGPRPRIAILTVSDAGARGERADASGDAIAGWAAERGLVVVARALVPDEPELIGTTLRDWADGDHAELVLTTGGTGLTARDRTPEATRAVLDIEAPGIAEALRMTVYPRFHRAALSRGVAGVRGRTLIVNLPGSPAGVRDGLAVLDDLVMHAIELVRGTRTEH